MIPVNYLRECFEHHADGTLTWRARPVEHFSAARHQRRFNAQRAGKAITTRNADGYLVATLKYSGRQRKLLVSRIAWALGHGYWPTQLIDHRNRVRDDNRMDNLREAGHALNAANRDARCASEVGVTGVSRSGRRFMARIVADRKLHYLGTFSTAAEAGSAFQRASIEMRGYAVGAVA